MYSCVGLILEHCCACVPGFKWEPLSDLGVVSLISQQTVTEKYEFVQRFLRFVLDLPTVELKCHLMPFAVSLCVFIIQPTTPWWCASQQPQYRASNLFICGEKGQANTLAPVLEVLYLSTNPNIWVAQASVHCPIVCGTACERRLFIRSAQHAHGKVNTQPLCVCVCLCVCLGGYISWQWRSQYSMAPSFWQVNMTFGATMKTDILYDLVALLFALQRCLNCCSLKFDLVNCLTV